MRQFFLFLVSNILVIQASAQVEYSDLVHFFLNERKQLQETVQFTQKTRTKDLINVRDREALRESWYLFINHHENLSLVSQDISQENKSIQNASKEDLKALQYCIFLAQYRSAIEMIRLLEEFKESDLVLNEPYREFAIPDGTLAKFKFHYLNIERFAEYSALRFTNWDYQFSKADLEDAYQKDLEVVEKFHQVQGSILTIKNAWKITSKITSAFIFPFQKGISEWMGDTKFNRWNQSLIEHSQIEQVLDLVRPGDILFQRREWYLSNIGLPGFWTHNALYIGTPLERKSLRGDSEVIKWVKSKGIKSGNLEELLQRDYNEVYQKSLQQDQGNYPYRILEAIGEGVSFTSIEHSGSADSMAALRPRLSQVDIAKAIYDSFQYYGRPYDFDFDFRTDSKIVCSELIFYAYQEKVRKKGLRFPMKTMLGRVIVAPNDIVKSFAESIQSGKAQQFDFIFFLDGNEKLLRSDFVKQSEFLESWKRPKWHILNQMGVQQND